MTTFFTRHCLHWCKTLGIRMDVWLYRCTL